MKVVWKELWPHVSIKEASVRNKDSVFGDTKQDMYEQAIKYLNDWGGGYMPNKQLHKKKVIIRYMERYYPQHCI